MSRKIKVVDVENVETSQMKLSSPTDETPEMIEPPPPTPEPVAEQPQVETSDEKVEEIKDYILFKLK